MPCCALVLIAMIGPRFAIAMIALFSDYFGRAYDGLLIPLLGFFFLPFTMLAYAWAINSRGEVAGIHLVVVIVAVLVDLGVFGGGASERRKRH